MKGTTIINARPDGLLGAARLAPRVPLGVAPEGRSLPLRGVIEPATT